MVISVLCIEIGIDRLRVMVREIWLKFFLIYVLPRYRCNFE